MASQKSTSQPAAVSREKVYLLMYPEHVSLISDAAEQASNETKRRFGRHDHNGHGDAFRHCLWSAMLCRDIGYMGALRYTSAHEEFSDNPPNEKAMDLHNNSVGLKLGRTLSSNAILSNLSVAALRSGQLKVIKP